MFLDVSRCFSAFISKVPNFKQNVARKSKL